MKLRSALPIKRALHRTRLFFPIRTAHRVLFDRENFAFERRMHDLYSQWIHHGDLVFDVGANHGMYSETFSLLGARVIAIEPNPALCDELDLLACGRDVTVVRSAVGDSAGEAKMRLFDRDAMGTISTEQKLSAASSDVKLIGEIDVSVTTLDLLAGKYGTPSFVKIDAEGFDDKVLRGLSFNPEVVTFEFSLDNFDLSKRCFEAPLFGSGLYMFNVTPGRSMECASQDWMDGKQLLERIQFLLGPEEYGDVIARLRETPAR
jgi:FkbM family methyltransferase